MDIEQYDIDNIVYTREKMIRQLARMAKVKDPSITLDAVRMIYNTLEDYVVDLLALASAEQNVLIKLFTGITIKGVYMPENTRINNLTGEEITVPAKIKPKFNVTKDYCEKIMSSAMNS